MSTISKMLAERLATIEAAAEEGRRVMREKGLTVADAVSMFAALQSAQRAEIMRHDRKNGSAR